MSFRRFLIGSSLFVFVLTPVTAFPQDVLPPAVGFSVVPFDFAPPGARSLGLGHAFIGVADDATASEANPAGLTILSKPEISVHGLYSDYDIERTNSTAWNILYGQNARLPTNRATHGFPPLDENSTVANAFAGDTTAKYDETESHLTFASFVIPAGRWVFSLYYNAPSEFRGAYEFDAWDDSNADLYRVSEQIEVSLETIGASAAVRISDRASFGFSVRHSKFDVLTDELVQVVYAFMNPDNPNLQDPAFYRGLSLQEMEAFVASRADIGDDYWQRQTGVNGSDSTFTYNAGLLFRPSEVLSIGIVYKDGGTYTIDGVNHVSLVQWNGNASDPGPTTAPVEFKLPDLIGLGFAIRPTEQLLIAVDINHVIYSNLDPGRESSELVEPVDDGTEFHLGIEYSFFPGGGNKPLSIRAGVFNEEDHDGLATIDSSETNYTIGFGAVLAEGFQLDIAGRFTDSVTSAALSFVVRF
jgi:long-subunit fatty acid transport protein